MTAIRVSKSMFSKKVLKIERDFVIGGPAQECDIVDFVRANSPVSIGMVCKAFNMGGTTARRKLRDAAAVGLLESKREYITFKKTKRCANAELFYYVD